MGQGGEALWHSADLVAHPILPNKQKGDLKTFRQHPSTAKARLSCQRPGSYFCPSSRVLEGDATEARAGPLWARNTLIFGVNVSEVAVNSLSASYVFGASRTEQQRLVDQAEGLEPEARWLLDHIGIEKGWRAADIGCGPIGVLNLLSERVGPSGAVVGIEREQHFADMTRSEIEKRGLKNASVVQRDALGANQKSGSFDLVHERLVLMNVPESNQKALVDQMVALLKPGGTIALQDYDRVSYVCYPEHPSWTILLDAYIEAFRASGGNGATGRSLPWLLRSAGVRDVQTKVHVRTVHVGESRRTLHLTMLEVMHEKVLALGRFSEREFTEHKKELLKHLSDPDTLLIDRLLVQAWGRKPIDYLP